MPTKEKDYFPEKLKTEIPREIFKILNIDEDRYDFSEDSDSGGGSTVTKQAWGKILMKLQGLQEKGVI